MAWVNSLWDLVPHPLTLGSLSLEGQLGWAPGSLRDDSWAGSGNLVLRKPPTEICLLSARIRNLEGESCVLDLALSCHLVLVAQLYLTLCNPMDSGTPGSPILHYSRSLLRFMSVELVMLSNQIILATPFSFCLQSLPASESFPMSWLFTSGGQIIGASASAPVLPMNIQG